MMRIFAIFLVGVVPVVLAWAAENAENVKCEVVQDNKPTEKGSAAEIEKLINDLGNDDFGARDAASKALLKIGEDALPFLKAVSQDADAERRTSAVNLYSRILQNLPLQTKVQRATKYGVDVLIERMVRKGAKASDEDWSILAEIVRILRAHKNSKEARLPENLPGEATFLKFPVEIRSILSGNEFGVVSGLRGLGGSINAKNGVDRSFLVSSGDVECHHCVLSVVFANGDIKCNNIIGSLVVCAGSITTGHVEQSVLIARDKISIQLSLGTKDAVIEDRYHDGMPNVKFFSLRRLGVVLGGGGALNNDLVGVLRVDQDSLFAKAGLKASDLIVSVNGVRLKEADRARALFRQAVADENLVLERVGGTLKVNIN